MSGGAVGASAATATPTPTPAAEPPKEKDSFTIKIGAVDAKSKIKVIKEVRTITGLGLKEVRS
jgi:large subunit ribosomal protein L7/L12